MNYRDIIVPDSINVHEFYLVAADDFSNLIDVIQLNMNGRLGCRLLVTC